MKREAGEIGPASRIILAHVTCRSTSAVIVPHEASPKKIKGRAQSKTHNTSHALVSLKQCTKKGLSLTNPARHASGNIASSRSATLDVNVLGMGAMDAPAKPYASECASTSHYIKSDKSGSTSIPQPMVL